MLVERLGVPDPVTLGVADALGDAVWVAVTDGVRVGLGVPDADGVPVCVGERLVL